MKRILTVTSICLLISAIVFAVMWQTALHDKSNELTLAQTGAQEAYTDFLRYRSSGEEAYYHSGVASFYSYMKAYYLIVEDTNDESEYTYCNELYAKLIFSPEQSKAHISEIVDTLAILAEDVQHPNGYNRMRNLVNSIG